MCIDGLVVLYCCSRGRGTDWEASRFDVFTWALLKAHCILVTHCHL